MTDAFPRIEPLGEQALLVRFAPALDDAANRACLAFRAALEEARPPGVVETASSLGSVLARFEGGAGPVRDAIDALLGERDWAAAPAAPSRRWRIPCAFGGTDGPQLAEAAALAGTDEAGAIETLTGATLRVLALGFAPGMPYLGILPPDWDIPRQAGLTPKVPEGALVVAVRQLVLFGTEAPTGWRQVGRTAFPCFDPSRARPIALAPGDEVRFEAVMPEALARAAAADPERLGGATWEAVG